MGAVFVFDVEAMIGELEDQYMTQAGRSLMRVAAIDDLPLNLKNQRQANPLIDLKADYRFVTTAASRPPSRADASG